ncbi:cytochrome c oxidase accessory protein CcoG [Halopseudomonas aestusnigri]|uniref:cytochrome c oxidase accessory protein CcoG n=1 Tax=Halopseudomonas aestusnigri TaxID=857252 RepID=UPI001E4E38D4|nr:cytochrome c oxidase accessory protein CcoG [Halopseudomonas aestusnigri]UGV30084.1 cytochrome c oxidase accessory protein CcoG [Halopseudomonas aestusnigri]
MTSHIPLKDLTPAQQGGPIHTRSFKGLYRNLRLLGAGALMVLFFGTAWIDWNGQQAVLWDLDSKQFHIFGATFWPQDFILLSAILMIAAFGLFFITVVAGRIWCGYSCPQSVWTWMFMWVEKVTEGERHQRIRLDAAPWSLNKLLRRGAKHGLWLAISLATAIGFIGYFTPVRDLVGDLLSWQVGATTAFWLLCFTAATYFNAGWLREKVCVHMCPYSRFQSAMFDTDTQLVTYDAARGEARGPRKKNSDPAAAGLGDCIDCTVCVQVCPTGIDIRDGLQIDCISCGACIDACNGVMDQMGYARGLIRYTSERALAGGKTYWLRPRLVGYANALLLMIGGLVWGLQERSLIDLDISRDRSVFRANSNGEIENIYTLKVLNKTQQAREYSLSLTDAERFNTQGLGNLQVPAGETGTIAVRVSRRDPAVAAGSEPLEFVVQDLNDATSKVSDESTFVSPPVR